VIYKAKQHRKNEWIPHIDIMRRILTVLTVFTIVLLTNSVNLGARSIYQTSGNTTEWVNAEFESYTGSGGEPAQTTYILTFPTGTGVNIPIENMFSTMDVVGGYDIFYTMPVDWSGSNWILTVDGVNFDTSGDKITGVLFSNTGVESTSYMLLYTDTAVTTIDSLDNIDVNVLFTAIKYDDSVVESYNNGYTDGYEDASLVLTNSGYIDGYSTGQSDLYTYGSDFFSLNQLLSTDFQRGLAYDAVDGTDYDNGYTAGYDVGIFEGSQVNVNAGMSNFQSDFDVWIVPAIVIVMLLGGFLSIYAAKSRGN